MTELVVGPLLRHVGDRHATVWVETSAPATVEVLVESRQDGEVARTGCPTATVAGHCYALVVVEDLPAGADLTYRLLVDGEQRWPDDPDFPAPRIRLRDRSDAVRIAFGSCLSSGPQVPPWTIHRRNHEEGLGPDALRALALRCAADPEVLPDLLLLLGDQVYADHGAPEFREWVRARRDTSRAPGDDALTFDEYAELYRRSWTDPATRWLLSTVATAMIFDDHEIIDDWNISASWVADIRLADWWSERITNGLASYWLYQHLGNMSPAELADDDLVAALRRGGDVTGRVLDAASSWDRGGEPTPETRWSHARRIGEVTVVVVDSRNGRILTPGGRRMLDDREHAWLVQQATSADGHLIVASSVPWLLSPGVHQVEAWCSAVADGAWGRWAAGKAEELRREIDLEHWSAFPSSWEDLAALFERLIRDPDGPDSVLVVSGDVHHSYAAVVRFPGGPHRPVWQLTSSPLRYPTPSRLERAIDLVESLVGLTVGRTIARLAGQRPPRARWTYETGPLYHNGIADLLLDGPRAAVRFLAARGDTDPRLEAVAELDVAGPSARPHRSHGRPRWRQTGLRRP